jgi:hypothetical protein
MAIFFSNIKNKLNINKEIKMEKKVGYPVLVEAVAQKGMDRPEYIELLRKVHRQKFIYDLGKNVSAEQVQSFEQKL